MSQLERQQKIQIQKLKSYSTVMFNKEQKLFIRFPSKKGAETKRRRG